MRVDVRPLPPTRALGFTSLVFLATLLAAGGPLAAQEEERPQVEAAPSAAEGAAEEGAAEGSARYDVIPISDGVVVLPLDPDSFERLEISERGLYLDGEAVSKRELRRRLGDEADELLERHRPESWAAPAPVPLPSRRDRERALEEAREEAEELLRERLEELEDLREDLREEELGRIEEELERVLEDQGRPSRRRTEGRVVFGRNLVIEEDESTQDVVVIGGSLDVEGEVRGDAVVVGGPIRIDGIVDGSATSVGSSVSLGPEATVDGDAVSVGGVVRREPGSRVRGEILELSFAPELDLGPGAWDWDDWWEGGFGFWPVWEGVGGVLARVWNIVVLAFLGCVVTLVARRPVDRVAERLQDEPWKALFVGLVAQILVAVGVPLLTVLLLISVVGILLIPLVIPLTLVAFALLLIFGYAAAATWSGRLVGRRFGRPVGNPYLVVLAGVVLIQGWSLVGGSLEWTSGPLYLSAVLLLVFGFFVKYGAWTSGLGAVLLDRFSPGPAATAGILPPPPPPSWSDDDRSGEWGDDSGDWRHDSGEWRDDSDEWRRDHDAERPEDEPVGPEEEPAADRPEVGSPADGDGSDEGEGDPAPSGSDDERGRRPE